MPTGTNGSLVSSRFAQRDVWSLKTPAYSGASGRRRSASCTCRRSARTWSTRGAPSGARTGARGLGRTASSRAPRGPSGGDLTADLRLPAEGESLRGVGVYSVQQPEHGPRRLQQSGVVFGGDGRRGLRYPVGVHSGVLFVGRVRGCSSTRRAMFLASYSLYQSASPSTWLRTDFALHSSEKLGRGGTVSRPLRPCVRSHPVPPSRVRLRWSAGGAPYSFVMMATHDLWIKPTKNEQKRQGLPGFLGIATRQTARRVFRRPFRQNPLFASEYSSSLLRRVTGTHDARHQHLLQRVRRLRHRDLHLRPFVLTAFQIPG
jgi:hypothetical protein